MIVQLFISLKQKFCTIKYSTLYTPNKYLQKKIFMRTNKNETK